MRTPADRSPADRRNPSPSGEVWPFVFKFFKIVGVIVALLVIAGIVGFWLLMRTYISDVATAKFPPHAIKFKVWAESDGDIKGHWVYYSVQHGADQQTTNWCLRGEWDDWDSWNGDGALTRYVSKDARFFVARWWQKEGSNTFFIIFDNEQHASLAIKTPVPERRWISAKEAWPGDWKLPYERLRLECSFLPELEW